ncbi:2Fe-2S iron-sulfur cluster-binding protein [Bacillus sp. 03113]|uniref:2Fe-2S iron-sulfur cluster-binding protein n=1 Tax=Bacillus sp. 03113 TaxID=2578211 RepID=UPI001143EAC1|nr:2Fe-2S iron-sulfur cluster-binding protein [Bacillus sp. 03113]
MPKVKVHVNGKVIEEEVKDHANLVVLSGIKAFPKIKYACGIGKCTKCTCKIINGAEHLAEPNWKEKKMLGDKLDEGFRLTCQLTITKDIELTQDVVITPAKKVDRNERSIG